MTPNLDIDIDVVLFGLLGGAIFWFALARTLNLLGFVIPRLKTFWVAAFGLAFIFGITYVAPTYIDRFIDGRDVLHSLDPLTKYVMFMIGMFVTHIWVDWRNRWQ